MHVIRYYFALHGKRCISSHFKYHNAANFLDSVIVIGFNLVTMQCKTLELSYLKRDTSETNALQEPLLK